MSSAARRLLDQAAGEAGWQQTFTDLARTLGWTCKHVHDSRREVVNRRTGERKQVGDKDAAGLPDWLLLRDRIVFVELKTEVGTLEPEQRLVLRRIFEAGGEAYVWQPHDLDGVRYALGQRVPTVPRSLSQANLTRWRVIR